MKKSDEGVGGRKINSSLTSEIYIGYFFLFLRNKHLNFFISVFYRETGGANIHNAGFDEQKQPLTSKHVQKQQQQQQPLVSTGLTANPTANAAEILPPNNAIFSTNPPCNTVMTSCAGCVQQQCYQPQCQVSGWFICDSRCNLTCDSSCELWLKLWFKLWLNLYLVISFYWFFFSRNYGDDCGFAAFATTLATCIVSWTNYASCNAFKSKVSKWYL